MLPFFDPTMIILVPGILFALLAQFLVKSRFDHYSKVGLSCGKTAAQVAREILRAHNLDRVVVERVRGHLSDHFDPRSNVVRLSESVYDSTSVAAVGVAAHEVGHAIQHAKHYFPITLRNALAPVVQIASMSWIFLFMAGMFLAQLGLAKLGIAFFAVVFLFQVITLPVEFDASARAMKLLPQLGFTRPDEDRGIKAVLSAAAMTYVAGMLQSLLQLVRMLLLVNGRQRD
ncbi:MAG: zinc metallopeptidase [Spirochaetia bacterium]